MLSWGMGWSGGAALAGALVRWIGTVPAVELLALVPVLAVAVAWSSPRRVLEERTVAVAT